MSITAETSKDSGGLRRFGGTFLYRYKPPNLGQLKSILLHHQLYYSSPNQYGHLDNQDAQPNFVVRDLDRMARFIHDSYRVQYSHLPPDRLARELTIGDEWVRTLTAEQLAGECKRNILLDISETYRICSFTTRSDNTHLWRDFAAGSTGCCLEFKNREQMVADSMIRIVEYEDSAPMDISNDDEVVAGFVFHKAPRFSEEEEVRAFLFPRGRAHQQSFDPQALRRIILGRNMSRYHRQIIEVVPSTSSTVKCV